MLVSVRFAAVALVALVSEMALPVSPASAATVCSWSVVTSPNGAPDQNRIDGIAADSATDAWAVGFYLKNNALSTLIEHWNGTAWSLSASRNGGPYDNVLSAVSADSTKDAWTVGYYYTGTKNEPLIEHWNGTAWAGSPSPSVGGAYGGTLNAVAALSPTNVWAAGEISTSNNGNTETLIEHWNGAKWSVVPSPNEDTIENTLGSIAAIAANDIWVGGIYSKTQVGFHSTLAEHWNGTAWSIVATRDEVSSSNNINAMASLATNNVYGAGDYYNSSIGHFRTLVQQWNGTSWVVLGSGNESSYETDLAGMAAVSPTEVFALGHYVVGSTDETFAEEYTGTGVRLTPTPNPGANGNYFDAGAGIPKTMDAWAAGGTLNSNGSVHQTLIERYHCT